MIIFHDLETVSTRVLNWVLNWVSTVSMITIQGDHSLGKGKIHVYFQKSPYKI